LNFKPNDAAITQLPKNISSIHTKWFDTDQPS